ncbi:MAG: VanZ family protein [Bacteroidales bacterium]|nr:VanZ family protein [Bacteroidales bacterium]
MSFPTTQAYIRTFFPQLPAAHWIGMGVLALVLAVFLSLRRKYTPYASITLGLTVLLGLFLLDALVLIRCGQSAVARPGLDLSAEFRRLVSWEEDTRYLVLFNAAVFVPFGSVSSEYLSSAGRLKGWRCLKYAVLMAGGLSLCIECLQLILRTGIFELTDLVLNTAGAALGAALPLSIRAGCAQGAGR